MLFLWGFHTELEVSNHKLNVKPLFSRVRTLFAAAAFSLTAAFVSASGGAPEVTLASIYKGGTDVSSYLVSEKLDGVRAYWDGEKLVSRRGNVFFPPDWFTKGFPSEPMDGELWVARNSFERTVSIVRRGAPHNGWKDVKYMVFDLPGRKGGFQKRFKVLERVIGAAGNSRLRATRQFRVSGEAELMRELERVTASGGEGLMLHKSDAPHRSGRSGDLLKLKKFYDAEAVVVAHNPGKGKFHAMMGSVTVETPEGVRFRIGTGFTDKQRANPPAIGSVITYKYRGFTRKGKPKFASFWRVRN